MEFLIVVVVLLIAAFIVDIFVRKSNSPSFGLSVGEEVLQKFPDLDADSARIGLAFVEALGADNSVIADAEKVAANLEGENIGLKRANETDGDDVARIQARVTGRNQKIGENENRRDTVATVATILGGAAKVV